MTADEKVRFRYAAAGFMCVASAALIGRAAGDAIFLSRFSADLLPYMYVGSAVVIAVAAYVYGAFAPRLRPERLIPLTAAVLVALTLGLWLALQTPLGAVRIATYFLADLLVHLPMMLFWGFASLVFNPREAKRLFGVVGAAGTAACIAAGLTVKPFAAQYGTRNLLLLVAVLTTAFGIVVMALARREASRLRPTPSDGARARMGGKFGYFAGLLRRPQARTLALFVSVSTLVLVIVDYLFKAAARAHYHGAELAGFLGAFYAVANLAALGLQLFLVHRILRRAGVLGSLAMLPSGMLVTSLGTAATTSFGWIVASKILDPILNFTVNNAAMQLLFLGIKKQSRGQVRTLVDGICKPVAMALTGALLIATAGVVDPQWLAATAAVGASIWLLLAWRSHSAYVAGLVDSVGARSFDVSSDELAYSEKALESQLRQTLLKAPDADVPDLLGVLHELRTIAPTPEVRSLLKRDSPKVKVAALDYLGRLRDDEDLPALLAHTDHHDAQVRQAAVHALGNWSSEEVVQTLKRRLEDSDPSVRAAAAAELVDAGDLDGLLTAGFALKVMLQSEDAAQRLAAASALSHMHRGGLTRLLTDLLEDENKNVRLTALTACKHRPSPALVGSIIPLLSEPLEAPSAVSALVAFGREALPELATHLEDAGLVGSNPGLIRIPHIIAEIGDEAGIPILRRQLDCGDHRLENAAIRAYGTLIQRLQAGKAELSVISRTYRREVRRAAACAASLRRVRGLAHTELLGQALNDERHSHLENAFALLDVTTRGVDMNALFQRLSRQEGDSRAAALEVMDNVLAEEVKADLFVLLEPSHRETPAAEAEAVEELESLLAGGKSEWVLVCALYAAAENGIESCADAVRDLLDHRHGAVRETALYALSKLGSAEQVLEVCRRLSDDPSPAVQKLAAHLKQVTGREA
jgi:HEAT repeat protein